MVATNSRGAQGERSRHDSLVQEEQKLYQQLQPRSRGLVRPLHPPPQPKGVVLTDGAHRVSIRTGLEPVVLKTKINN